MSTNMSSMTDTNKNGTLKKHSWFRRKSTEVFYLSKTNKGRLHTVTFYVNKELDVVCIRGVENKLLTLKEGRERFKRYQKKFWKPVVPCLQKKSGPAPTWEPGKKMVLGKPPKIVDKQNSGLRYKSGGNVERCQSIDLQGGERNDIRLTQIESDCVDNCNETDRLQWIDARGLDCGLVDAENKLENLQLDIIEHTKEIILAQDGFDNVMVRDGEGVGTQSHWADQIEALKDMRWWAMIDLLNTQDELREWDMRLAQEREAEGSWEVREDSEGKQLHNMLETYIDDLTDGDLAFIFDWLETDHHARNKNGTSAKTISWYWYTMSGLLIATELANRTQRPRANRYSKDPNPWVELKEKFEQDKMTNFPDKAPDFEMENIAISGEDEMIAKLDEHRRLMVTCYESHLETMLDVEYFTDYGGKLVAADFELHDKLKQVYQQQDVRNSMNNLMAITTKWSEMTAVVSKNISMIATKANLLAATNN